MKNTKAQKRTDSKTWHRWTPEEDARLLAAIKERQTDLEQVGQPGGVPREVFWAQIPGKADILATPVACAMRWRTLTSETKWAQKRRQRSELPRLPEAISELPGNKLEQVEKLLTRLLDIWTAPGTAQIQ